MRQIRKANLIVFIILMISILFSVPSYADGSAYDGLKFKDGVKIIENVKYEADESKRILKTDDKRMRNLSAGDFVVLKKGSGDKAIKVLSISKSSKQIKINYVIPAIGDILSDADSVSDQSQNAAENENVIKKKSKIAQQETAIKFLNHSTSVAQTVLMCSTGALAVLMIICSSLKGKKIVKKSERKIEKGKK